MENGNLDRNTRSTGLPFLERKHKRASELGLTADITEKSSTFHVIVDDFSTNGLKLSSVANGFDCNNHSYTVLISRGNHYFKLLVKPCWQKLNNDGKESEIGCKILDAPWKWIQFTMQEQGGLVQTTH
jgi:hypothetical protein